MKGLARARRRRLLGDRQDTLMSEMFVEVLDRLDCRPDALTARMGDKGAS
jgi:hypothetical protein